MSDRNTSTQTGGIGFWGLLQIVFIVLKLLDKITWSWWIVLLPTIISGIFSVIILIFVLVVYLMDR